MTDQNCFKIFKESIYIRVNGPSLSGKYHLPHIYDDVLSNTLELKIRLIVHTNIGNTISLTNNTGDTSYHTIVTSHVQHIRTKLNH